MPHDANPEPELGRPAIVAGLALFPVLTTYFALRPAIVLGDPDLWWHVQTGLDILRDHRVPYADHYSYTFAGQPWIAKEWLSQVLLAGAYRAGGWSGVMVLAIAAAAAALVALFLELARHLRLAVAATAVVAIAVVLTPVVIARPHIFTLLPLVILSARLLRAAAAGQPPQFWLLALVALWANLHGSFTLALVIGGFAVLLAAETTRFADRALLARWLGFLALAALATLLTHYGLGNYGINFSMMSGNETMPFITEWQPFSASRDRIMELGLLAAFACLVALRPRLGWARLAWLIFILHMFLLHVRFVYVFFLLAPLLVITPDIPPRIARRLDYGAAGFAAARLRLLAAALCGSIVAAMIAVVWLQPFAPEKRRSIEDALAFVRDRKLDGPVFNGYNLGGVLIFNGIKTYLDGRTEQLFRGPFMDDYLASGNADGAAKVKEIVERHGATWAIFPRRDIRNSFLGALPGWHRAYEDEFVIIHLRDTPALRSSAPQ